MTAKSPTPLSNAQVEILIAFAVNLNEHDLQDFKKKYSTIHVAKN